jgi:hypothetical protein
MISRAGVEYFQLGDPTISSHGAYQRHKRVQAEDREFSQRIMSHVYLCELPLVRNISNKNSHHSMPVRACTATFGIQLGFGATNSRLARGFREGGVPRSDAPSKISWHKRMIRMHTNQMNYRTSRNTNRYGCIIEFNFIKLNCSPNFS